MKKKNIALTCLALFGVFSLASCNQKARDEVASIVTTDTQAQSLGTLADIVIDTTNVRKQFYIGDDFNADGLVVTATYIKVVDGQRIASEKVINDYYLDTTEIDFNHAGEYKVYVVYREGRETPTKEYTIKCSTSRLDESNNEYLSGLEVGYTGKTEYTVGEAFSLDTSAITCKLHFAKATAETRTADATAADLTIDTSKVDTSKEGDYMVKFTKTETVEIEGQPYTNVASTFIIITVKKAA